MGFWKRQWEEIKPHIKAHLFILTASSLLGSAVVASVATWIVKVIQKALGDPLLPTHFYVILGILIASLMLLAGVFALTFSVASRKPTQAAQTAQLTYGPDSITPPRDAPIPISEALFFPPVNLRGEILELLFYSPDNEFSVISNEFVVLRSRITNHGADEVTVTNCRLEIRLGDFWQGAERVNIPTNWRVQRKRPNTLTAVYDEMPLEPALGVGVPGVIYKKGHPQEGWLAFQLHLFHDYEYPNAQFILHLTDSLGGEHQITREPAVYNRTGTIAEASEDKR